MWSHIKNHVTPCGPIRRLHVNWGLFYWTLPRFDQPDHCPSLQTDKFHELTSLGTCGEDTMYSHPEYVQFRTKGDYDHGKNVIIIMFALWCHQQLARQGELITEQCGEKFMLWDLAERLSWRYPLNTIPTHVHVDVPFSLGDFSASKQPTVKLSPAIAF